LDPSVARVVELFADAPLVENGWLTALGGFASAVGAGRAQIIGIGAGSVGLHLVAGMDDVPIELQLAQGVADPRQSWRLASSGGVLEVVHERHYAGARAHVASDAYDALCEDIRIEHGAQSALWQDDDTLVGIASLRGRDEGVTPAEELRRFAALLPFARMAVRMQRALDARGVGLTLSSVEAVHAAAFLLDAGGRVVDLNDRAAAAVRDGWVRLPAGRLTGRVATDDAPLQAAMAAALRSEMTGQPERIWLAPREDSGERAWCEIFPLPARDWAMLFQPRALVMIHRTQPLDPGDADTLRILLGLTASEADVALRLANGVPRHEIARARGSAPGTVAIQLKQVLHKAGVRREGELVALVNRLLRR